MPNTEKLSPTAGPGPESEEADADRRLVALAQLASQTGRQDESLTIPERRVRRFLDDFVAPVQQWCQAHANKIGRCYLAEHQNSPAVFVIGSGDGYDYSLSKPLADLEMELHRRGWASFVLQLPAGNSDVLQGFAVEAKAIQVCPLPNGATHAHS